MIVNTLFWPNFKTFTEPTNKSILMLKLKLMDAEEVLPENSMPWLFICDFKFLKIKNLLSVRLKNT